MTLYDPSSWTDWLFYVVINHQQMVLYWFIRVGNQHRQRGWLYISSLSKIMMVLNKILDHSSKWVGVLIWIVPWMLHAHVSTWAYRPLQHGLSLIAIVLLQGVMTCCDIYVVPTILKFFIFSIVGLLAMLTMPVILLASHMQGDFKRYRAPPSSYDSFVVANCGQWRAHNNGRLFLVGLLLYVHTFA